jgi:hypothetical protein
MTETYGDWETPAGGPTRQDTDLARRDAVRRDLDRLRDEVARIEAQVSGAAAIEVPARLLLLYNLVAGLSAGCVAAAGSLLFNIVGALVVNQHPLEIIRVYLTIPIGERALALQTGPWLAAGVCLYLAIGAVYGIPFRLVLAGPFSQAPTIWRLLAATIMGLVLWVLDHYLILGLLQPLTGEPHLHDLRPAWLAALTHVVFAWTILLFERRVRLAGPVDTAAGAGDLD